MRMWFEILPTLAIIYGVHQIPSIVSPILHYVVDKNPVAKDYQCQPDGKMNDYYCYDRSKSYPTWWTRKSHLKGHFDGDIYRPHGLEMLADEEPTQQ